MATGLTLVEKTALLSGKNTWLSRDLPEHGIPSISFADGPHGVRKQLGSGDHLGLNASVPATCFPTASALASSWDPLLLERVGTALGVEAAHHGVHVLLGPGLNLKRDPRCGRSFEYVSEDPYLAGTLAAAMVRGIQSTGTSACPKHFAVNSQETRRMASDSVVDERSLRELYLTAFEIVVREAGPDVIMSSYNRVNGTYAHENPHLLTQILRDEWGFDGLVVTDWGGGNDPVAAVKAGGTLEMPTPGVDSMRRLLEAVDAGDLTEQQIDVRVHEVLDLAGRQRPRVTEPDLDAHHALAREAASASAVLLKNDEALLPLAPGTTVALIGDMATTPRYQGAGSSLVNPTRLTVPAEAIAESTLDVVAEAQGYIRTGAPDEALLREAVAAARCADVPVLFLGLDELRESEGLDRSDLTLAPNQVELLAAVHEANARTVVVLAAGAPVEMPWIDSAQALLHMHLSGQAGGQALADLLTGAAEPRGRLAETYARTLSQHATADTFPAQGPHAVYSECFHVGYRHFDSENLEVRFPFGFGLGYGSTELSDLTIQQQDATSNDSTPLAHRRPESGAGQSPVATVEVTVRNTGERATSGVVQVYISRPESALERPVHELAGFARVQVEPGQQRTARIELTERAFRHYDIDREAWVIEAGPADIHVGRHSRDLPLHGTLTLEERILSAAPADPAAPRTPQEAAARRSIDASARNDRTELDINDPLRAMEHAPSRLARGAHALLELLLRRSQRSGHPDLNLLFLYNMPFRAISKMSGGLIGSGEVEGILDIVNAHPLRGLRTIARHTAATRRATGRLTRQIEGR